LAAVQLPAPAASGAAAAAPAAGANPAMAAAAPVNTVATRNDFFIGFLSALSGATRRTRHQCAPATWNPDCGDPERILRKP
jgi:hypothetical protein